MNPTFPLFLAVLVAASLPSPKVAAAPSPPNILLVMVDDMGFSDLGCYGGEVDTPHLDQLAAHGLRFTQFYNTGRCWPTRASLMTGRYPHEAGHAMTRGPDSTPHRAYQGTTPDLGLMIPELLNPAGYRSYHVGKWHLDSKKLPPAQSSPEARGFHRSYKIQTQHNFFNPWKLIDEGTLIERPAGDSPMGDGQYYLTDDFTGKTIEFLTDHFAGQDHASDATANTTTPFFLYLAHTAPHFPLHARQEDIDRHRERYRIGWDVIRANRFLRLKELGIIPENTKRPPRDPESVPWKSLSPGEQEEWATRMAIHAAMIHRVDHGIGRIVDHLRETGQLDNTLILFLSDNGASAEYLIRGDGHDPAAPPGSGASYLCLEVGWATPSNTPFRMHKMWTHEGGIATPLIAHWPTGIPQSALNQLIPAPSHVIDILPTCTDLAHAEIPADAPPISGQSLAPLFAGNAIPDPPFLFWEHTGNKAIRVGDWKLVAVDKGPWELYNLADDRNETRNLITQNPEKAESLKKLYHEKADAMGVVDWQTLPMSKSSPGPGYRKK